MVKNSYLTNAITAAVLLYSNVLELLFTSASLVTINTLESKINLVKVKESVLLVVHILHLEVALRRNSFAWVVQFAMLRN